MTIGETVSIKRSKGLYSMTRHSPFGALVLKGGEVLDVAVSHGDGTVSFSENTMLPPYVQGEVSKVVSKF